MGKLQTDQIPGSIGLQESHLGGGIAVGMFHTHPYSEGYTWVAFSSGDIESLSGEKTGFTSFVESGSKRFALEIQSGNKATKFLKNNNITQIWYNAWKNALKNNKSYQDAVKEAVKAVIKKSGGSIKFYESVDKKKEKYKEVK